jgi:hypothetical protein
MQIFATAELKGWVDDIRLTIDPARSVDPDLVTDSQNNIYVVWTDGRTGSAEIFAKIYDGNEWGEETRLDYDEIGGSYRPAISKDSQNNIHVVFVDNRRTDNKDEIYYTTYNGVDWSSPVRITFNAVLNGMIGPYDGPEIVIDDNDNIYVFWAADLTPVTDDAGILYVVFDGTSWSPIQIARDDVLKHIDPAVSTDMNNNIHLVYTTLDSEGTGSYYNISYQKFNGISWTNPIFLDDVGFSRFPAVAADSMNNVHVVWDGDGDTANKYNIWYTKLDVNGNTVLNDLKLTSFDDCSYPDIAVDTDDNIHLLFSQGTGTGTRYVYYLKLDNNGNTLIGPLNLTTTWMEQSGERYRPPINVDSNGIVHIAFQDKRNDNHDIYYKRNENYDLSISSNDVKFSNILPENNEDIIINATIYNNGGFLINATVYFYLDSIDPQNVIDSELISVPVSGTEDISIQWSAVTGTHTIWVKIENEDGIEETNLTNNIASKDILVNDPPSISIIAPPSGIVNVDDVYAISWNANDPDDIAEIQLYYDDDNTGYDGTLIVTTDQYPSGIEDNNGVSLSYNWDTTGLSDGSSFYIYAKIDDGLHDPIYVYSSGKIKIDHENIAPTIEINSPSGGEISGIVNIQGIASDDVSVSIVEIKIDNDIWVEAIGTTSWSYEWYTNSYTNGEHTIRARAKDNTGLYSQEDSVMVMVNNGGNIVPSVEIKSHSKDEVVGGIIEIKGSSEDHDGNVELVEIKVDNVNWQATSGTSSWSYFWDTTTYSNGEHGIYVRAKDNSQEYSQIESITLIVSNGGNVPPIVTIISPLGGTVSGTVTIRGSASDLDGDNTISYVEIKIDNDWESVNGINEWSYEWDTSLLDDGNYTIYIRAFDETEYSLEKSVEVSVDNPHEPTLTITSEIPEEATGTVKIQGTAYDVDGDIIKIEIQIDNGEWEEISGTINWDYDLDTTKLSDGEHTIRIRAYDDEGEYYEESFTINVDNSSFIIWLIIIVVFILIVAFIVAVGLMRKKPQKTVTEPLASQPIPQTATQSIRCPQCSTLFEVPEAATTVQCPFCGTSGTLN